MAHYRVPKFGNESGPVGLAVVTAFAVYDISKDTTAFHWPLPSCYHCHDGHSYIRGYSRVPPTCIVLPPPLDWNGEVTHHEISWRRAWGLFRIVWEENTAHAPGNNLRFHSIVHSSRAFDHPGYMRLESSQAADIKRTATIVTPLRNSRLRDLSWNESTGKICALIPATRENAWADNSQREDFNHSDSIVIIDLLG